MISNKYTFYPHHIPEEILEQVYVSQEENQVITLKKIQGFFSESKIEIISIINELIEDDLLCINCDSIFLTDNGFQEAKNIVRRNRLGERLLADVLAVSEAEMVETACKFEHILTPGVEEAICTLLGHPTICPHDKPIPSGKCCKSHNVSLNQIILPITKIKPGESGTLRYIKAFDRENNLLSKVIGYGLVPGKKILLKQKKPTYIVKFDETILAIEENIAELIYIRLNS